MNIWICWADAVSKRQTATVDSSYFGMIHMHIHFPIIEKEKQAHKHNVKLKRSRKNNFNNATYDNATPLIRHLSVQLSFNKPETFRLLKFSVLFTIMSSISEI